VDLKNAKEMKELCQIGEKARKKRKRGVNKKKKKSASIIFEKTMEALFIIYLSLSISEISEETKSDTQ